MSTWSNQVIPGVERSQHCGFGLVDVLGGQWGV
jgi:hypothetical protein